MPFLGRLPVYQPISLGSDRGIPIVIAEPDAAATRAFAQVAERVAAQVGDRGAQECGGEQGQDSVDSDQERSADRLQVGLAGRVGG